MGQTFTLMGSPDPRLDHFGSIHLSLKRQSRGYAKSDPPPNRMKPIPFQILLHMSSMVHDDAQASTALVSIADMICIAVYFLMRPGEYCASSADAHPFRIRDVELFAGPQAINISLATETQLLSATYVRLTFSTQKNGVRGERVGQGLSGHPRFCPVRAVAWRLLHLRLHDAPPETPLHCYFDRHNRRQPVKSQEVTQLLHRSVTMLGQDYNLSTSEVDCRSLRPSGAMALLCSEIDPDNIRIMGRWKSDAMLRYLHAEALPMRQHLAQAMLQGGQTITFHHQPPEQGPGEN